MATDTATFRLRPVSSAASFALRPIDAQGDRALVERVSPISIYKVTSSGICVKINLSPEQENELRKAHLLVTQRFQNLQSVDYMNSIVTVNDGQTIEKISCENLPGLDIIKNIVKEHLNFNVDDWYNFKNNQKAPSNGTMPFISDGFIKLSVPDVNQYYFYKDLYEEIIKRNPRYTLRVDDFRENFEVLLTNNIDGSIEAEVQKSHKIGVRKQLRAFIEAHNDTINAQKERINAKKAEIHRLRASPDPAVLSKAEGELETFERELAALENNKDYVQNKNQLSCLEKESVAIENIDKDAVKIALFFKNLARHTTGNRLQTSKDRLDLARLIKKTLPKLMQTDMDSIEVRKAVYEYCFDIASLILKTREEYLEFALENNKQLKSTSIASDIVQRILGY